MDLHLIWFFLIGVLFTGYAMLDGFDFGVGTLHLLHRTDEDRRISINAIGPVWDGNEVWLVVALIAAALMLMYRYRQIALGKIRETNVSRH